MNKTREPYWDTAKGVLIFFVVLGHVFFSYRFCDSIKELFDAIILFSMPVFVFISGYLSKSPNSASYHSLSKLLVLYIIFNSLYIVWFSAVEGAYQLTEPYYVNWYLIAVIVWRFVTAKLKPRPWVIGVSFVAALLAGFWPDIDNQFALGRIICFYPWFLAGWHMPADFAKKWFIKKRAWSWPLGGVLMLVSVVGSILISNLYQDRYWLTWHYMMNYYTAFQHLYLRMVAFGLSVLFLTGFLLALPRGTCLGYLQERGRNSLWIFIFHRPFTIIFAQVFGEYNVTFYPWALLTAIVLVSVLGLDCVAGVMNKTLESITCSYAGVRALPMKKQVVLLGLGVVFCLLVLAMPVICGKLT